MIEDKLNHDERLRLECVAQANVTVASHMGPRSSPASETVLDVARRYENFVRGPSPDAPGRPIWTTADQVPAEQGGLG